MKQVAKNIIKLLILRPYYAIRNIDSVWHLLNWKHRRRYKGNSQKLNSCQQQILNNLKQDGIAVTHVDILLEGENFLPRLQEYFNTHLSSAKTSEKKDFFIDIWSTSRFLLTLENPFVQFILHEKITSLASAYMEMYARLHGLRAMKTVVVNSRSVPTQSQLWHRDPDDKKLCKVFIYLNDVDEETGPFCYIAESQYGGKLNSLFPQLRPYSPGSGRIVDQEVEEAVPPENIKVCTGRAGTMIFADTAGLHKGGYSTKHSRSMALGAFMSWVPFTRPSRRKKFLYPHDFEKQIQSLAPIARYAVRKPFIEIP